MYSRRQRSTRNAAATTNANANANARTTRGRTSKAKNPRRGGGNPDTARVRASIERAPVVPWIKVLRPPSLHLRRTFLVEKWVRPSDLTAKEREVYDEKQKEKKEDQQRLLKWQQQKREQEERERDEQLQREQKENMLSQEVETATEREGQDVKDPEMNKDKQESEISAAKPIFETSVSIESASTKLKTPTTAASNTEKSDVVQSVPIVAMEQIQDPSRLYEREDRSTAVMTSQTSKSQSILTQTQASSVDTLENESSSRLLLSGTMIDMGSQQLQEVHKDELLQRNESSSNKLEENFLAPVNENQDNSSTQLVCNSAVIDNTREQVGQDHKEKFFQKCGSASNKPTQENCSTTSKEQQQKQSPDAERMLSPTEPLAKKMRVE